MIFMLIIFHSEEKLDDKKSILTVIKKWPKKGNTPQLIFKSSDPKVKLLELSVSHLLLFLHHNPFNYYHHHLPLTNFSILYYQFINFFKAQNVFARKYPSIHHPSFYLSPLSFSPILPLSHSPSSPIPPPPSLYLLFLLFPSPPLSPCSTISPSPSFPFLPLFSFNPFIFFDIFLSNKALMDDDDSLTVPSYIPTATLPSNLQPSQSSFQKSPSITPQEIQTSKNSNEFQKSEIRNLNEAQKIETNISKVKIDPPSNNFKNISLLNSEQVCASSFCFMLIIFFKNNFNFYFNLGFIYFG